MEVRVFISYALRVYLVDSRHLISKLFLFLICCSVKPSFFGLLHSNGLNLQINHRISSVLCKMQVKGVYFHILKALEQDTKPENFKSKP